MATDLPPFSNLRKALTDLEKCLTCAYCSRIYTDPFTLKTCGHTFCEHCVIIFVSGIKAQSLCPLCNIPIWLNQSQTNRQLKGILQHYLQIRSLLGIKEPINNIPNYLKPKPELKRRKARKKAEKLFINPSKTVKSPQIIANSVSTPDQSMVQTDDNTLKRNTRSLRCTETIEASTCDLNHNIIPQIIDSNLNQEVNEKEANSNSGVDNRNSPAVSGFITNALSYLQYNTISTPNSFTKLCDDVIPTNVLGNNDKLTSTPANAGQSQMFNFSSKSEMLPRSLNFSQLIGNEDSSSRKLDSHPTSTSPILSLSQKQNLIPNIPYPVIQLMHTSPIIPLIQKQDFNVNIPSPIFQQIPASVNPVEQKLSHINVYNSQKQDSIPDILSPVIQNVDTSTVSPSQKLNCNADTQSPPQSPVIQLMHTSPVIPLTQKQDSSLNSQSSVVQKLDEYPINPPEQENTHQNLYKSKEPLSNSRSQSPDIIQLISNPTNMYPNLNSPSPYNNPIASSNLLTQKQDSYVNTVPSVIQQIVTSPILSPLRTQDNNASTRSPSLSPVIQLKHVSPTTLYNSQMQLFDSKTQSPIIQQMHTSPVIPFTEKQDSPLNTHSSVVQKIHESPINPSEEEDTHLNLYKSPVPISNSRSQSPDIIQMMSNPINMYPNVNSQSPNYNNNDQINPSNIILTQKQDYNAYTQSPVNQQMHTSPIIPFTQKEDYNISTQSPVIENIQTSFPKIPLEQENTPINLYKSNEQHFNPKALSPDIIQQISNSTSMNPNLNSQSPYNNEISSPNLLAREQDSYMSTQVPAIQHIQISSPIPLTQKQDYNANSQPPDIQQAGTPTILEHKQTPFSPDISDLSTQLPIIEVDNSPDISHSEELISNSLDDSVIIESVHFTPDPITDVSQSTNLKNSSEKQPCEKVNTPPKNAPDQSHKSTKQFCSKATDVPRESNAYIYANNMCVSQPIPFEHIIQAQENLCRLPQIRVYDSLVRFPPINPMAQLSRFQTTSRASNTVYYYPYQAPIRPNIEEPSNNFDFRVRNDLISPQKNGSNISANHFGINKPIQKKRNEQLKQHKLLQYSLELEQKRLEQITNDSADSKLSSLDSREILEPNVTDASQNYASQCNDLMPHNIEIVEKDNSQGSKENFESMERTKSEIKHSLPSGNSISDCFLRKYSLQLSPCSYLQNSQINEVLSVARDLSNKISRLDSDEDSNFSLSHQSPKFIKTIKRSPIINSTNRIVTEMSPDNEFVQRNFTPPRVPSFIMDSYNSEMPIDNSLNIIDYADMSIDESLYKEKHFSPSLTSPIPCNNIKRRSNGLRSKKIKLSVGGVYNKPKKDSKSKSLRALSPRNELNQLLKPKGRTRSRRSGYPQVN